MTTCSTCKHYGENGAGEPGYCLYGVGLPPVMKEMLAALEAEPAAHIQHTVFDGMEISTPPDHSCSCYYPAPAGD